MKQKALFSLCLTAATAALMTGCATKQESAAWEADREAADVTAAEERAMQAEVSVEPAPTVEAEPTAEPTAEAQPTQTTTETAPAAQQPAPQPVRPQPVPYTVTAGDSVSALAVRFGVRQPDILALNPEVRKAPDRLRVGQKVLLPPGTDVTVKAKPRAARPAANPPKGATVYTVRPGDVLGGIALTHGVTVKTIVEANKLKGDTIFVGQKLVIPGAKKRGRVTTATDPASKPAAKPAPAPAKPAEASKPATGEPLPPPPAKDGAEDPDADQLGEEPLPPPPAKDEAGEAALPPAPQGEAPAAMQTYVVQPGEDLVAVSFRWGVSLPALRAANGLDEAAGNDIPAGTTLKIPLTPQAQ